MTFPKLPSQAACPNLPSQRSGSATDIPDPAENAKTYMVQEAPSDPRYNDGTTHLLCPDGVFTLDWFGWHKPCVTSDNAYRILPSPLTGGYRVTHAESPDEFTGTWPECVAFLESAYQGRLELRLCIDSAIFTGDEPSGKVQVGFQLPVSLKKRLVEHARRRGLSMVAWAIGVMDHALRRESGRRIYAADVDAPGVEKTEPIKSDMEWRYPPEHVIPREDSEAVAPPNDEPLQIRAVRVAERITQGIKGVFFSKYQRFPLSLYMAEVFDPGCGHYDKSQEMEAARELRDLGFTKKKTTYENVKCHVWRPDPEQAPARTEWRAALILYRNGMKPFELADFIDDMGYTVDALPFATPTWRDRFNEMKGYRQLTNGKWKRVDAEPEQAPAEPEAPASPFPPTR